jgi:hypothetical protein
MFQFFEREKEDPSFSDSVPCKRRRRFALFEPLIAVANPF